MKQLFLYGVFGGLTTVLNIFAYWALTRGLSMGYILNRKVVFKAVDNVRKTAVRYYILAACQMLISFLLVDLFAAKILKVTGVLDVIIMWLFVDVLGLNDVVIKTASNILVIILNYAFSKLLIFKGERKSKP